VKDYFVSNAFMRDTFRMNPGETSKVKIIIRPADSLHVVLSSICCYVHALKILVIVVGQ